MNGTALLWAIGTALALWVVYLWWLGGEYKREAAARAAAPPEREWMLWVGDGTAPAGPHLVGTPVNIDGRTGKVVDATALLIQVEWDHA